MPDNTFDQNGKDVSGHKSSLMYASAALSWDLDQPEYEDFWKEHYQPSSRDERRELAEFYGMQYTLEEG